MTAPPKLFDQFPTSDKDGTNFMDHNDEIRSILVYIGLITIILFLLAVLFSLISKCIKVFDDETITTKKKIQPQSRRYRTNSLTSRQTILSSLSSPSLSSSYYTNKSLRRSSLTLSGRTHRYQKQYPLPILHV